MLILRREQMEVFRDYELKIFEKKMVERVNDLFPKICCQLNDSQLRDKIRKGIDRAKVYAIKAESDVAFIVDLIFTFGENFDEDPNQPWAREILSDPAITNPEVRVELLRKKAITQKE